MALFGSAGTGHFVQQHSLTELRHSASVDGHMSLEGLKVKEQTRHICNHLQLDSELVNFQYYSSIIIFIVLEWMCIKWNVAIEKELT